MHDTKYRKNVAKRAIAQFCWKTGLVATYRSHRSRAGRNRLCFLGFHDVSENGLDFLSLSHDASLFRREIDFLVRNYEVLSIAEALQVCRGERGLDEDAFVLTFDDNFKSFATELVEIKAQYQIPMTIFVASGPVRTGEPLFVDGLCQAFRQTSATILDLRDEKLGKFPIRGQYLKRRALARIIREMRGRSALERKVFLKKVCARLSVDDGALGYEGIDKEDLLRIRDVGIEIGAHTVTHPSLAEVDPNEAKGEIAECKTWLENVVDRPVRYFAYPYGDRKSYNAETSGWVREAGYEAALTLEKNAGSKDVFRLARRNISKSVASFDGRNFSEPLFALETSGLADVVLLRFMNKRNGRRSRCATGLRRTGDCERRLCVVFLIDSLEGIGGTEGHLLKLAGELERFGARCIIVAFKTKERAVSVYREHGVRVEEFRLQNIYGLDAGRKFFRLVALLRRERSDLVQTFHFMSDTFGVLAARLAGIRRVISSRRDTGDLKKRRQVVLNKVINPLITRFITVCDRVGELLSRSEKVPRRRQRTIYNGLDPALFPSGPEAQRDVRKCLGFGNDKFVVGISCILRPEKDVGTFLRAMQILKPEIDELNVLVIGDGPEKENLERFIAESRMVNWVKMTGYAKDVRRCIPAADVMCLTPVSNEGLSNVLIEEMAMGKPIVATDVGGNAEVVSDGQTGFIVAPRDPAGLAEKIRFLWQHPKQRERMGKAGRERVERYFSLDKMVDGHLKLYGEVLGVDQTGLRERRTGN